MSVAETPSASDRSLGLKLAIIRVTAALSMIYGLLYVFTAFLVLSGALSQADEAVSAAAFAVIGASAIPAALILLMAIFGFRAARDRSRVLPFCVVSVPYAVLMIASMAFAGLPSVASIADIIALAYNVLVVVSACVAVWLVRYNRQLPADASEAKPHVLKDAADQSDSSANAQ